MGICTFPYSSPYPIEKVRDSPYPYPINVGIFRQNGNEFGQYPWRQIYLSYLSDILFFIRGSLL